MINYIKAYMNFLTVGNNFIAKFTTIINFILLGGVLLKQYNISFEWWQFLLLFMMGINASMILGLFLSTLGFVQFEEEFKYVQNKKLQGDLKK